jgi:hypothetical protein
MTQHLGPALRFADEEIDLTFPHALGASRRLLRKDSVGFRAIARSISQLADLESGLLEATIWARRAG